MPRRRYYQPRQRRSKWEWPDPELHPAMGVTRSPTSAAWRAAVGTARSGGSDSYAFKTFSDSAYGGAEAALEAAEAWCIKERKARGIRSHGWKLGPNEAGTVWRGYCTIRGHRYYYYTAALSHAGVAFRQSFNVLKYGEDQARAYAEYALSLWRKQIAAIAKLPLERQRQIAMGRETVSL